MPEVFTRWQGIELMNYSPFIYSYGQRNIAVTGAGTLNGQADANHWWNWKTLETNTLRGGYVLNTHVYRVKAGTVGGPLLLIQGTYNNQTGNFPPDVSNLNPDRLDRGQLRWHLVDHRCVGQ